MGKTIADGHDSASLCFPITSVYSGMQSFFGGNARAPFTYAAGLAFPAAAWLLSSQFPLTGSPHAAFVIFSLAVIASAAIGGHGPALVAAATSLLALGYFFIGPSGAFTLPTTPSHIAATAAFAGVAGLSAWMSRLGRQAVRAEARARAAAAALDGEVRRRDALLELSARALAGGSIEALRRDAVTMTVDALALDHCAVLELTREGGPLVAAAAAGWNGATIEGMTVAADIDTQPGYALYAREPVIVSEGDRDARFSVPAVLRAAGARSGIAVRMAGVRRTFGVFVTYTAASRAFDAGHVQFVAAVAAILSGLYERKRLEAECGTLADREQANRAAADLAATRATFLAQTATVFDTALEPEATLVSLARLAVPSLAECAIVDLVHDDGYVRRVEVVDVDPSRREATAAVRRQAPNLSSETPFSRAIRTGQPALLSRLPERDSDAGADPEHEQLMTLLESQSLLLVPLVARGQTLGLLTLASRRRTHDPADLALAQELAGRAAIALDNARLYREAQAASRAKDDFLATVSHELRTPINAVLGWAAILRQHRLDESRAEYACEAIERSARAQAHLLEQLLDVSRAISGKLELHLAPAHIGGIVEAAVDTVRPDADDKQIRIATRLDRSLPLVMLDPERLQQVVVNLLSNAVKFSPEDGVVQVELCRDDKSVEIMVQDHGIGIRREFLPYVFDRFRQGGNRTGANRGLGLGMSIARDIVERHGGAITAESGGEGTGARFTVRLPLSAVTTETTALARQGNGNAR